MTEETYLQMILSLKSKFDIFLSHKINQVNKINKDLGVFTRHYT